MLSTNIVIDDMDYRICGFSEVKAVNKTIAYTGSTHYMDPNCKFLMSYHHSYSGEYITLGNRGKYPIAGYGNTLV